MDAAHYSWKAKSNSIISELILYFSMFSSSRITFLLRPFNMQDFTFPLTVELEASLSLLKCICKVNESLPATALGIIE